MSLVRLDKYLSSTGEYSRSEAKVLLKAGRVTLDGISVTNGDIKIDSDTSQVYVDGNKIGYSAHYYIMMNKPAGVLSATEDSRDRTVLDLLSPKYRRLELFPAGRLDKDTEGLLILTDDGEFCHNVISPNKKVTKVYYAEVIGQLDPRCIDMFREGITLADGYKCRPAELEILSDSGKNACIVRVGEGKFHQVKRMISACNCQVSYLKRLKIGGLDLDPDLPAGGYRELDDSEVKAVLEG